MPDTSTDYINNTKYDVLVSKINNLNDIVFDLTAKLIASRKLRYAIVDIETERSAGRIAPDEIYVPQHIIDTNIRREQSSYIQFITQSPRAVILKDRVNPANDMSLLEVDLTEKLRFDSWQLSMYANIDGFQANGYGIMETVLEPKNPGNIGREYVQYGDFAFIADTRDLQKTEMTGRAYYFTRTKLKELTQIEDEDEKWNIDQVQKLLDSEPNDEQANVYSGTTTINKSLYKVMKIMFRVKGIVQVAWVCPKICDGYLRKRALFLGRRKINDKAAKYAQFIAKTPPQMMGTLTDGIKKLAPEVTDKHIDQMKKGLPPSDMVFETQYPYFLYPYLVSENDTISSLKGRVFLDQDTQTAATSLLSSTLSQARRASYLLFSKDTSDPNDDFLMQKNTNFKPGAIINGKLKEMKLDAPDPTMFTAIQTLVSANQAETSQINFAETNRQADSRKTATAIKAATQQSQQLSGVQVTLFSIALKNQYTYECDIIKSRVLTGVLDVNPILKQLYALNFTVKPSGDTDVIEKQQMIQQMQQAWPVVQNTGAAPVFLADLLEKMFPDSAQKYLAAIQQQQQQQNSGQQQQIQHLAGIAKQVGEGISKLAEHPDWFSETGRIHAFPVVEYAKEQYQQIKEQMNGKK